MDGLDPIKLSKLLSYLLRHKPEAVGLTLDERGFTPLDELIVKVNASGRFPRPISAEDVRSLIASEGARRFEEKEGKVRARSGHTAATVTEAVSERTTPPEFLFVGLGPRRGFITSQGLEADPPGRMLRLYESERAARRAAAQAVGPRRRAARPRVVVIEAGRAGRSGVEFFKGEPGVFLTRTVPRRHLISERAGFERQVSAGGVLARGVGDAAEIALIRTQPRETEEHAPPPSEEEPIVEPVIAIEPPLVPAQPAPAPEPGEQSEADRRASDRRAGEERRFVDHGPPDGIERRRDTRRRRRRRGGFGPDGRLELPKGKVEPGETPRDACLREVKEETGITSAISIRTELPKVRYAFRTSDGRSVFKTVHYYLLSLDATPSDFVPRKEEGIVAVEWVLLAKALDSIAFANLRPVLEAARDALGLSAGPGA
jgi:putative RNA 2'-phosphotransferase